MRVHSEERRRKGDSRHGQAARYGEIGDPSPVTRDDLIWLESNRPKRGATFSKSSGIGAAWVVTLFRKITSLLLFQLDILKSNHKVKVCKL